MAAKRYETLAREAVSCSLAKALCRKIVYKNRIGHRGGGTIASHEVLGIKVRLIWRSEIDFSIGTDEWNVRFRFPPLEESIILRGDPDAFNRDMTVMKMVGSDFGIQTDDLSVAEHQWRFL